MNLRAKAIKELTHLKKNVHKQRLKDDMRHNYVYDVMYKRWQDRDTKLAKGRRLFPAENSFPMELRSPDVEFLRKPRQELAEGELPNDSETINNNSVKLIDEIWPRVPTIDDYAK